MDEIIKEFERLVKIGAHRRTKEKEIDKFLFDILTDYENKRPEKEKLIKQLINTPYSSLKIKRLEIKVFKSNFPFTQVSEEDFSNANIIIEEKLNNLYFKSHKTRMERIYKTEKEKYKTILPQKKYKLCLKKLKESYSIPELLENYYLDAEKILKEKLDQFEFKTSKEREVLENEFQRKKEIFDKKQYELGIEQLREDYLTLLENNYLSAEKIIKEKLDEFKFKDSEDRKKLEKEFKSEKIKFIQNWIRTKTRKKLGKEMLLDKEQAEAVGSFGKNYLVSARAGSGKTRVLISRAFFLIEHCNVPENEILLLAFNKKAVEEVRNRLKELVGNRMPYIRTFHALAYGIVNPEETILFDGEKEGNKIQSKFFQEIIDKFLRDEVEIEAIKRIMLEGISTGYKKINFEEEWRRNERQGHHLKKDEFLKYRASIRLETLDGKRVKSELHKSIANIFFKYGLEYRYESNHNVNFEKFKVDFRVYNESVEMKSGIVVQVLNKEEKNQIIEEDIEKSKTWNLINITEEDKNLEEKIIKFLEENNFNIKKLEEEEIWNKIKGRVLDSFTDVTKNFVIQCRKNLISPKKLGLMIDQYETSDEIEIEFYYLCERLYKSYIKKLNESERNDFDGILINAIKKVTSNNLKEINILKKSNLENLKYIFIDEFQDFSKIFYELILGINNINKNFEVFCVGDDWQAINGFAGSDLEYFENFSEKFMNSKKLNISTNYRSSQSVVKIGNALQKGYGVGAKYNSNELGYIRLVDLKKFKPSATEREKYDLDNLLTPVILRIIKANLGKSIMLISRKGKINGKSIEKYCIYLRSFFNEKEAKKISINTAHKSKGLESEVTILLDVISGSYPLIHPHWVFTKILGNNIEKLIEEERRLLYVALTRAEKKMYIITETDEISEMLLEIKQEMHLEEININSYDEVVGRTKKERKNVIKVKGGTYSIKEELKKLGYKWNKSQDSWEKVIAKKYISFKKIPKNHWMKKTDYLEITLVNDGGEEISKFKSNHGIVTELFNFINHKDKRSLNGYSYNAIYDYNSITFSSRLSEKEIEMQKNILDFKDGKNTDYFANKIIEVLEYLYLEEELKNTIIIPIPASTEEKTKRRYYEVLQVIEERSSIKNGYDLIKLKSNTKSKHRGNKKRFLDIYIYSEELKGKNLILLDDVITTGQTFDSICKKLLRDVSPIKLEGLFIGRTIQRKEENF